MVYLLDLSQCRLVSQVVEDDRPLWLEFWSLFFIKHDISRETELLTFALFMITALFNHAPIFIIIIEMHIAGVTFEPEIVLHLYCLQGAQKNIAYPECVYDCY